MPTIVSSAVIAEKLGITQARVRQLVAEGLPRVGHGKYDLEGCMAWAADMREDHSAEAQTGIVKERTRYYAAQADSVEHRLKQSRGEVVALSVVTIVQGNLVESMIQAGDTWVDQAQNAHELKHRQSLWWDLRKRISREAETFVGALASAQGAQTTGLRNRRQVG